MSESAEEIPDDASAATRRQEVFDFLSRRLYKWMRHSHAPTSKLRSEIEATAGLTPDVLHNLRRAAEDRQARGLAPATASSIARDPPPPAPLPIWYAEKVRGLLAGKRVNPTVLAKKYSFLTLESDGPATGRSTRKRAMLGSFQILQCYTDVGGMGLVFKGKLPGDTSGRHVALKVMKPERLPPDGPQRFTAEARILADLALHPNVVQGVTTFKEPVPHIAMDLVYGPTLWTLLTHHEDRPVPVSFAIDLIRQMAQALEAAHGREPEVVHRDLKPENVLLEWVGRSTPYPNGWQVRVCDFGLAVEPATGRFTMVGIPGTVNGTPGYQAPEQLKGDVITPRCDIFLLGIIAYELLTGRHPFNRGHRAFPHYDLSFTVLKAPHLANQLVGADVGNLVGRMLQFEPGDRPYADAVVRALSAAVPARAPLTPRTISHKVFISHTTRDDRDRATAQALGAGLTGSGKALWIGPNNVPGESDRKEEITRNLLEQSSHFLLILSARALDSESVRTEMRMALDRKSSDPSGFTILRIQPGDLRDYEEREAIERYPAVEYSLDKDELLRNVITAIDAPPPILVAEQPTDPTAAFDEYLAAVAPTADTELARRISRNHGFLADAPASRQPDAGFVAADRAAAELMREEIVRWSTGVASPPARVAPLAVPFGEDPQIVAHWLLRELGGRCGGAMVVPLPLVLFDPRGSPDRQPSERLAEAIRSEYVVSGPTASQVRTLLREPGRLVLLLYAQPSPLWWATTGTDVELRRTVEGLAYPLTGLGLSPQLVVTVCADDHHRIGWTSLRET